MRIITYIVFLILPVFAFTQSAKLKGRITDEKGMPVEYANISVSEHSIGIATDRFGMYSLVVPSNEKLEVSISCMGFEAQDLSIELNPTQVLEMDIILKKATNYLPEMAVEDKMERHNSLIRLNPEISTTIPTSGGFEDLIKTLPGVSSNNELSSQYSVRGGNFDENLVYVNDIEIYRPLLIRSGQQEGLSFINPDLISSVIFSSGGFEAKYGDKMSSVLDIKYRKPNSTAGSLTASLLGVNAHFEGVSKDHRFRHITGIRYKSTKYVLGSMDTEGAYDPRFTDVQTYLSYDVSDRFELSFLGNYSRNVYKFVPQDRETSWGTLDEALKIKMYFEGQEVDKFSTLTGAFTGTYRPSKDLQLKFIVSGFHTNEQETFDILSQYYLNELDKQLGSDNLGDSVANIGVGSYLDHARNYLDGYVFNAEHKASWKKNNHFMDWGVSYKAELFDYSINEWQMNDSAGYTLPYSDTSVDFFSFETADYSINSNRISAYWQNKYIIEFDSVELGLVGGLRVQYWDFNNQFVASPRVAISYKPNWEKDFMFRLSTGIYHQPPFFKELRKPDGNLNYDIKAQSSVHVVLGSDYQFQAWKRPFKLMTELYYKYMYNLIPYDVDNVRIRYYGENLAHGYAVGFDLKLNGEFVKGTDSWMSLSIMQTQEDIEGDFYLEENSNGIMDTVFPGFIPRPTDQRVNFGIYFADYLPGNPTWQVFLNLLFGTGLPFGPPNSDRYLATSRIPPYRRVDIGFSKQLVGNKPLSGHNPLRYLKSLWLTAEVFNILDINNTISHIWVSDIYGRNFAVPNYLTGRRINIKLVAKF
jgi:hypothetical protein